jgi:ABC-type phosphate transport system substrate-binding protein
MNRLRQLTAGVAIAAAVAIAASTAPAAFADPVAGGGKAIVPKSYDIVGVGADTDQFLFDQLSADYNQTITPAEHSAKHPWFLNWDATKPGSTSPLPTKITAKAGCATITRPNGGNAGLKALDANAKDGKSAAAPYCIDFARTSSGRATGSPAPAKGGVLYVALATDAVTYATRDTGATKTIRATYAPKSLTLAQLKAIYTCKDLRWSDGGLGGPNQPIKAYLPQAGAATTTFWLKKLGITAPGPCVNQALEQNQGLSKQFNSPNAIFIYSVADWIAQKYHSPKAGQKPTAAQNKFGTNEIGFLGLNKIDGISPVTTAKIPTINTAFKKTTLTRTIYDIVRWAPTANHIPAYLNRFFGPKAAGGYVCSNKGAIAAIADYGFLPTVTCGSGS